MGRFWPSVSQWELRPEQGVDWTVPVSFLVWIIWVSQTNWKTNWKTLARLQQTPSICWGSLSQNGNRIGPAFTTTTTCTTRVNKQTLARVSFCFQLLLLSSRRLVSVTSFRCAHSARTHLPPIIYLRALSVCSPCPDFRNNPLIASTNKSNFNHPLSLLTRAIMTDFTVKGHFLFPLSVSSRQYCSRQYKTTHDTRHILFFAAVMTQMWPFTCPWNGLFLVWTSLHPALFSVYIIRRSPTFSSHLQGFL